MLFIYLFIVHALYVVGLVFSLHVWCIQEGRRN